MVAFSRPSYKPKTVESVKVYFYVIDPVTKEYKEDFVLVDNNGTLIAPRVKAIANTLYPGHAFYGWWTPDKD